MTARVMFCAMFRQARTGWPDAAQRTTSHHTRPIRPGSALAVASSEPRPPQRCSSHMLEVCQRSLRRTHSPSHVARTCFRCGSLGSCVLCGSTDPPVLSFRAATSAGRIPTRGRDTLHMSRTCRDWPILAGGGPAVRAGFPGTGFPILLNRTEIKVLGVLSKLGAGARDVSLVGSIDTLFASPCLLSMPCCAALRPFSKQL